MEKSGMVELMSSHRGFILAVSGAAVGIGSIWRMPYLIGEHGGSLFIICYLFFIFVLGIPAMIAEVLVGRIGRKPPIIALQNIASASLSSRQWGKIAISGTLASVLILSFYSVVSGWAIRYFAISAPGIDITQTGQAEHIFNSFLENPWSVLGYSTVFMLLTFTVSAFKINKGIERLNDILMPLLYLILLILVIYVSTLPGFSTALHYLFTPDWSQLSASMLLTSMGMAFFTLATGACCLMAYGAYMPEKQSVLFSVSVVAAINLFVTLCAGIAIFSIVFSYGMNASSGPGLIFMALPVALSDMPFGMWILPVFFFLLIIACWTSSVNLAEPLVSILSYKCGNRVKGAMCSAIIVWILGLIPVLSFNVFKEVKVFGTDVFSAYTGLATDIILPVTGFFILIFAGHIMSKHLFFKGMGFSESGQGKIWYCLIRYISPIGLFLIFLANFIKL